MVSAPLKFREYPVNCATLLDLLKASLKKGRTEANRKSGFFNLKDFKEKAITDMRTDKPLTDKEDVFAPY